MAHFTEFALLALAWRWALRGIALRPHTKTLVAWLLTALYAVSDEWHQSFVPGRHADWRDVAVDHADLEEPSVSGGADDQRESVVEVEHADRVVVGVEHVVVCDLVLAG